MDVDLLPTCDVCNQHIFEGTTFHHCTLCSLDPGFDACSKCYGPEVHVIHKPHIQSGVFPGFNPYVNICRLCHLPRVQRNSRTKVSNRIDVIKTYLGHDVSLDREGLPKYICSSCDQRLCHLKKKSTDPMTLSEFRKRSRKFKKMSVAQKQQSLENGLEMKIIDNGQDDYGVAMSIDNGTASGQSVTKDQILVSDEDTSHSVLKKGNFPPHAVTSANAVFLPLTRPQNESFTDSPSFKITDVRSETSSVDPKHKEQRPSYLMQQRSKLAEILNGQRRVQRQVQSNDTYSVPEYQPVSETSQSSEEDYLPDLVPQENPDTNEEESTDLKIVNVISMADPSNSPEITVEESQKERSVTKETEERYDYHCYGTVSLVKKVGTDILEFVYDEVYVEIASNAKDGISVGKNQFEAGMCSSEQDAAESVENGDERMDDVNNGTAENGGKSVVENNYVNERDEIIEEDNNEVAENGDEMMEVENSEATETGDEMVEEQNDDRFESDLESMQYEENNQSNRPSDDKSAQDNATEELVQDAGENNSSNNEEVEEQQPRFSETATSDDVHNAKSSSPNESERVEGVEKELVKTDDARAVQISATKTGPQQKQEKGIIQQLVTKDYDPENQRVAITHTSRKNIEDTFYVRDTCQSSDTEELHLKSATCVSNVLIDEQNDQKNIIVIEPVSDDGTSGGEKSTVRRIDVDGDQMPMKRLKLMNSPRHSDIPVSTKHHSTEMADEIVRSDTSFDVTDSGSDNKPEPSLLSDISQDENENYTDMYTQLTPVPLPEETMSDTKRQEGYTCHICSQTVQGTGVEFHKHLRRHTGELPWSCGTCLVRFNLSGSLRYHLQKYGHKAGPPPLDHRLLEELEQTLDQGCYADENLPTNDSQAMPLHRKRDHRCSMCDAAFYSPYELREHERSHIPKLTHYPCEICRAQLPDVRALQGHIRQIHNTEYTMFCSLCQVGFIHVSQYDLHHQRKHAHEHESTVSYDTNRTPRNQMSTQRPQDEQRYSQSVYSTKNYTYYQRNSLSHVNTNMENRFTSSYQPANPNHMNVQNMFVQGKPHHGNFGSAHKSSSLPNVPAQIHRTAGKMSPFNQQQYLLTTQSARQPANTMGQFYQQGYTTPARPPRMQPGWQQMQVTPFSSLTNNPNLGNISQQLNANCTVGYNGFGTGNNQSSYEEFVLQHNLPVGYSSFTNMQ